MQNVRQRERSIAQSQRCVGDHHRVGYGLLPLDQMQRDVLRDRKVRIAQFSREVCEQFIVQGKLSLQGAIGHPPAAAQQGDHLIEHRAYVTTHGDDMPLVKEWRWDPSAKANTGKRRRSAEAVAT